MDNRHNSGKLRMLSGNKGILLVITLGAAACIALGFNLSKWFGSDRQSVSATPTPSRYAPGPTATVTSYAHRPVETAPLAVIPSVPANMSYSAWASSVYTLKYNQSDYSVDASMAVDGKLKTAWNEGDSGNGTGEWIRLTPSDGQRYTYSGFKIANGFQYHDYYKGDRWTKNNRVASLSVYADERYIGNFYINDQSDGYQTVYFNTPVECNTLRFEITSVWINDAGKDCCISEIRPF